MKITKLKINTKNKAYSIFIGKHIINKINKILFSEIKNFEKVLLVVDSNVPNKFQKLIELKLKKYKIFDIKIKTSEKEKNINTVNKIIEILLINNFNRNDCVIALGGGILGDIIGFAASIFKRGIKFINIPTTLLSQVDSSIGGKTGVNSKYGKNLIGSFYQPDLVISDLNTIKTLPKREIICGYAEILKHSLILDKKLFNWLYKNGKKIINNKNDNLLKKAIYESCKIKARIVSKDEKENNLRKILNFGHTFAHAFESTLKYKNKINHGEAVLLGIECALEFAYINKLLNLNELKLIRDHYKSLNLPSNIKKYFKKNEINKIIKFMKADKKNFNKNLNLIILRTIGKTPSIINFPEREIKDYLKNKLK